MSFTGELRTSMVSDVPKIMHHVARYWQVWDLNSHLLSADIFPSSIVEVAG